MTLDHLYRRLRRLFPAEWRERNEDELLATLHDAAEGGRRSASPVDAVDLVRSAVVLRIRALRRLGAPGARPGRPVGVRAPEPVRLVAWTGLAVVSAVAAGLMVRSWVSDVSVEFLLTSLVVVLVPGTGVVYTISSAISGGWRRGFFAAVGCTLGIVPHVLAAMLGLSGIMQTGAVAFEAVRWLGVAYLVFMGVSMLRSSGGLRLDDDRGASTGSADLVVRRGVLLNLLNPKLTVFFLAFLPQFLDSPPGLMDPRLVGLSGVFMLITLAVFVAYARAAAAVRDRVLGTPAVLRWAQRTMGTLVIGFAARLAVADR